MYGFDADGNGSTVTSACSMRSVVEKTCPHLRFGEISDGLNDYGMGSVVSRVEESIIVARDAHWICKED
jgi:hypothetical protein